MKKIKYMALLLMAGMTFAACSEEDDFNPAEDEEKTAVVNLPLWTPLSMVALCSMASLPATTVGQIPPPHSQEG